jgi:molecular chaperone GrpE
VSKEDPSRAQPADEPRSEPLETGRDGPADSAVDESQADAKAHPQDTRHVKEAGEPEQVESEVDRLQTELEEAKDRALRVHAELDNYRKRVARQMDEERRYANLPLIRDLLPVWDNVGRAIEAAEKTQETASLLEGFRIVAGELEGVLERHHCTKIDALGQPFNPHFHEAILQQPADTPPNTVLQVVRAGFCLHDRVVRPAQVIVSAAPPEAHDAEDVGPPSPNHPTEE